MGRVNEHPVSARRDDDPSSNAAIRIAELGEFDIIADRKWPLRGSLGKITRNERHKKRQKQDWAPECHARTPLFPGKLTAVVQAIAGRKLDSRARLRMRASTSAEENGGQLRSEERRVGKECRSRW